MRISGCLACFAAVSVLLSPCLAAERVEAREARRLRRKVRRRLVQKAESTKAAAATDRLTRKLQPETEALSGKVSDHRATGGRLAYNLVRRFRRLFKLEKEKVGGKSLRAATEKEERRAAQEEARRKAQRLRKKRKSDLLSIFGW